MFPESSDLKSGMPEANECSHGSNNLPNIPDLYLSIVIPIAERHDDLEKLYAEFVKELKEIGKYYEFIFVVNEGFDNALSVLKGMRKKYRDVKIISLNRNFGEATALSIGFKKARGRYILTLHPYFQIVPSGIKHVITKLEEGNDLVITRRYPRVDSFLNRVQTVSYHWIIKRLTGISFRDMSSGLRGLNRKVARELTLYGDLHRFIPILAQMQGFKIAEVDVRQCPEESNIRIYKPGVYLRRLLDVFTVFFLFKFTKKPLRFFGLIGFSFFTAGFFVNLYLSVQRLMGLTGLANRPLLLLGILVMVLGIQIASIGLLGEIIIFTHAKESTDYQIEEILE